MRYSYGILDKRKIILYNPQLFLTGKDILIFPSKDFHKWHGDFKEYVDGLYQINYNESFKLDDLNLAMGVLHRIIEESQHLFDVRINPDLKYQYVSTMEQKYKKLRKNNYSSDMRRCDIKIPVKPEITSKLRYLHQIEIIEEAWSRFYQKRK